MQFTIYDGSMENCPQLYLEKIDENIKWFTLDGQQIEIPTAYAYYCLDNNPEIPSWYITLTENNNV